MEKVTFHVISHTHWDREWYLPFEKFRLELVELIDNLLNILEQNTDFVFHLDGQSIILQDYLEIKPHNKEKIKDFVKSGNILVGPWYVLSDGFLTSGEATIRNLIYGTKLAEELGGVMLVGYLPDQFGHIAQLPQIFKGFNINSAIVGRGIQDSLSEHIWHGINGDNLIVVSLTHWYNNAQRFPVNNEEFTQYIEKIYTSQVTTSICGHILLMNGCDHLFPQVNVQSIINKNRSNEKWEIITNSLPNALSNIIGNPQKERYPICFSELRDDNNKYILAGTLSSRVYLKLANYRCQTKLEKIVEPLSALIALLPKAEVLLADSSYVYPYDQIKYAWKLLIQNHAHDSICGCSIDEVHREMEVRFAKVMQVLDKLQERLLLQLNNVEISCRGVSKEGQYLQLINLTSYKRSDVIEAILEFPLGPPAEHPSATPTINKEKIKKVLLKKEDKDIDCETIDSEQTFKMVRSKDEVPLLQAIQKVKVLFEASIDPFSIVSYEIKTNGEDRKQRSKEAKKQRNGKELEFENEFYDLKINKDGTLSITLAVNHGPSAISGSCKFENIHFVTIEDDLGDEYNFVPNKESQIVSSKDWDWEIKVIEENSFRKRTLLISRFESTKVEITITCYKNSQRIDFETEINNKLKNKRVRLHFPTNLNTNYVFVDTQFGVLQRARPPIDWINYATTQPLHNWICHSNNHLGLAFFSGGLADYELYEDGNGFAITLIRAVGRLSQAKSHSLIETPEAECQRVINFSYAVFPHLENWESQNIQKEQLLFQVPTSTSQSNIQINSQFFSLNPDKLVISCLKRAETKEDLYVLRIFNPHNEKVEKCSIRFNFQAKKLMLLNLNEEEINEFKNYVNFEIEPYQILTVGIEV